MDDLVSSMKWSISALWQRSGFLWSPKPEIRTVIQADGEFGVSAGFDDTIIAADMAGNVYCNNLKQGNRCGSWRISPRWFRDYRSSGKRLRKEISWLCRNAICLSTIRMENLWIPVRPKPKHWLHQSFWMINCCCFCYRGFIAEKLHFRFEGNWLYSDESVTAASELLHQWTCE